MRIRFIFLILGFLMMPCIHAQQIDSKVLSEYWLSRASTTDGLAIESALREIKKSAPLRDLSRLNAGVLALNRYLPADQISRNAAGASLRQVVRGYLLLGDVYCASNNLTACDSAYKHSLSLIQHDPIQTEQLALEHIHALSGQAQICKQYGLRRECITIRSEALRVAEQKIGVDSGVASQITLKIANDVGASLPREKRNDNLRTAYRAAQRIAQLYGSHSIEMAEALREMWPLYMGSNYWTEAIHAARHALDIYERTHGPDHEITLGARFAYAKLLLSYTDHPQDNDTRLRIYGPIPRDARTELKKAERTARQLYGPDDINVGHVVCDYPGGIDYSTECLHIVEKNFGALHPAYASATLNLGALLLKTPRKQEGLTLIRLAEAVISFSLEEVDSEQEYRERWRTSFTPSNLKWARLELARAHAFLLTESRSQGQIGEAIFWGKRAVQTLQLIRRDDIGDDVELEKQFFSTWQMPYQWLAELLIGEGRIGEAENILRLLKQRELEEILERIGQASPSRPELPLSGVEEKVFDEYKKIRQRQAALIRERQNIALRRQQGLLTGSEIRRLQEIDSIIIPKIKEVVSVFSKSLQAQLNEERGLSSGETKKEPRNASINLGEQIRTLQVVVDRLNEGASKARHVAIQYVVTEQRISIVLTIPNTAPIVRQISVSRSELVNAIANVRLLLQDRSSDPEIYLPKLQELYAWLIAPIRSDLRTIGAENIMLSLTDNLRYLPFSALHDGSAFLIERYSLSIYNEAVETNWKQRALHSRTIAAMGLSEAVEDLPALKYVPKELDLIASIPGLSVARYLNEKFNIYTIEKLLDSQFSMLHIASHFDFNSARLENSALILGDRHKLTLREIVARNWSFKNFDLVNFSACETGMGRLEAPGGQEVGSLGALVQRQGASSAIITLWRIADAATPDFMHSFYQGIMNGLNKGESLQTAQLRFLGVAGGPRVPGRLQHPYYWAPFVLMGDWH